MKFLLLLFVALVVCGCPTSDATESTMIFSPAPTPMPMWTNCSSVSTPFTLDPQGGSFFAIGCTFTAIVTVNVSTLLNKATTASLLMADGIVKQFGGIRLKGPSNVQATIMGSLNIVVRNMIFGSNAGVSFAGALPSNSSLILEGNSFILTSNLFAILITQSFTDDNPNQVFSLSNSSYISIAKNSISAQTSVELNAILVSAGSFLLTDNSSINIIGNVLSNSSVAQSASAIYFDVQSSDGRFVVTRGSFLNVSGNTITDLKTVAAYVVYWSVTTPSNGAGNVVNVSDFSGVFFDDNNIINVSNLYANADAVYWNVDTTGSNAGNLIFLTRNARISMCRNRLQNVRVPQYSDISYALAAVAWDWQNQVNMVLDNGSSIVVEDNFAQYAPVPQGNPSLALNFGVLWSWRMDQSQQNILNAVNVSFGSWISWSGNSAAQSQLYLLLSLNWNAAVTLSLSASSSFFINRNNMYAKATAPEGACIRWIVWGPIFNLLIQNSSLAVSNNSQWTLGRKTLVYVGWLYSPSPQSIMRLTNGSSFLLTGNGMYNQTNDQAILIYWSCRNVPLELNSGSWIEAYNNTVQATSDTTIFLVDWPLFITGGSRLMAIGNTITGYDGAVLEGRSINVTGYGMISVSNNTIIGLQLFSDQGNAPTPFVIRYPSKLQLGSSYLIVTGNIMLPSNLQVIISNYPLISVNAVTFISGTPFVSTCGNNLTWRPGYTGQLISPNSLAQVAQKCTPPTTTTTTTTTTRPTSTRPTPRPTTTTTTAPQPTPKPNIIVLIGIIAGVVAAVMIVTAFVIYYKCCRHRLKRYNHEEHTEDLLSEDRNQVGANSSLNFETTSQAHGQQTIACHSSAMLNTIVSPAQIYVYSPAPPAQPYTYSVPAAPINQENERW